jgi:hypothetical protein
MLSPRFGLRIVSSWSTNWAQDGAAKHGICKMGVGVECCGLIVPQVCRRAVPECRRQGFVDSRFEREDGRGALLRFLRIESLKACDAFLQPLDATPLLSDRQGWRFWLGRRNRTTAHENPSEIKNIIIQDRRSTPLVRLTS